LTTVSQLLELGNLRIQRSFLRNPIRVVRPFKKWGLCVISA